MELVLNWWNWFWIAIFTDCRKSRLLDNESRLLDKIFEFWGCADPASCWGNTGCVRGPQKHKARIGSHCPWPAHHWLNLSEHMDWFFLYSSTKPEFTTHNPCLIFTSCKFSFTLRLSLEQLCKDQKKPNSVQPLFAFSLHLGDFAAAQWKLRMSSSNPGYSCHSVQVKLKKMLQSLVLF